MLRNRIILIVAAIALIVVLYNLPKVVVDNDSSSISADSLAMASTDAHAAPDTLLQREIDRLRNSFIQSGSGEKNAIFADSLADLYYTAGKFDSAAWYADKSAAFFNTTESWIKAGESFYQAFTFEIEQTRQNELAARAQAYFKRVLQVESGNLEVKSKLAMTYMTSTNPMEGITLLREVLTADPRNESALFNMGMLSIQSGQYDRAIERLTQLKEVNPAHIQGQLLLGVAYSNTGNKRLAQEQFEKVKKLSTDPAVQATADSYLKDLK